MSVHSYTRKTDLESQLASPSQGNPDLYSLIETAIPGKGYTLRFANTVAEITFEPSLDATETLALDTAYSDWDPADLDAYKDRKMALIDSKSSDLIEQGFQYPPGSGIWFSLSDNAQRTLIGVETIKDDPALTYPIEWNTKDNKGKQSISDPPTMHGFYLTALGTVRAIKDGGTTLKDLVKAATTKAEVDAVEDNR